MFKVKLGIIIKAQNSLNKLLAKELPVKTSYKLSRLVSKLNSELQQFNETRDGLIKKFGKKEGKDSWYIPENDTSAIEKFQKEIEVLEGVNVEISGYTAVKLEELNSIQISPIDLSLIEPFLVAEDN